VIYVDPPLSITAARRKPELRRSLDRPRLRVVAPNLARLTPIAPPGMERPGMSIVTSTLMARAVRAAAAKLGAKIFAVIESSALVPIMGRCGEELKVYWAQDDFVGSADLLGLSAERIRRGEDRLLATADLVIAANPDVEESVRPRTRRTALIPYGCDLEIFTSTARATPAADVTLSAPIAGFMGHIGERIDVTLLNSVADTGISLLLVGPRHPRYEIDAMSALLARPNVQWVGPKEFEELPRYLATMEVALIPYNDSPFNRGSFPLKTLEYLAAGLPVVATDLPAIRWLQCQDITIRSTPAEFAAAVTQLASGHNEPAMKTTRRQFAARHTWEVRASAFAEALGLTRATVPAAN
jgi:teichuronic acid biosynthesis glycosyltransferase TuaH